MSCFRELNSLGKNQRVQISSSEYNYFTNRGLSDQCLQVGENMSEGGGDSVPLSCHTKFGLLSEMIKSTGTKWSYCNFIHWRQSKKYFSAWNNFEMLFPLMIFLDKNYLCQNIVIKSLFNLPLNRVIMSWSPVFMVQLFHWFSSYIVKKCIIRNILVKQNI